MAKSIIETESEELVIRSDVSENGAASTGRSLPYAANRKMPARAKRPMSRSSFPSLARGAGVIGGYSWSSASR